MIRIGSLKSTVLIEQLRKQLFLFCTTMVSASKKQGSHSNGGFREDWELAVTD